MKSRGGKGIGNWIEMKIERVRIGDDITMKIDGIIKGAKFFSIFVKSLNQV